MELKGDDDDDGRRNTVTHTHLKQTHTHTPETYTSKLTPGTLT